MIAVCALIPLLLPEAQAASLPSKVVISYPTVNARLVPLWIAGEEGLFSKYGVEAEAVLVRNSPVQITTLISGDAQISLGSPLTFLSAVARGADLKVLANFSSRTIVNLLARPGINGPRDLHGKRIGVQSIGGNIWLYAMLVLEHMGLDPGRDDIRIQVIGDQMVLSQALEAGTVDATVFSDPVYIRRLRQKGFPTLAELSLPIAALPFLVKRTYADQHPQIIENVLKALLESVGFVLSPRNQPTILKTIMRRLKVSDPSIAEDSYQELIKILDRKLYPSIEGLKSVQRMMKARDPKLADIKVEDLVDDSFIRKLDESGFIDRL